VDRRVSGHYSTSFFRGQGPHDMLHLHLVIDLHERCIGPSAQSPLEGTLGDTRELKAANGLRRTRKTKKPGSEPHPRSPGFELPCDIQICSYAMKT
jgi:hypothetical protein